LLLIINLFNTLMISSSTQQKTYVKLFTKLQRALLKCIQEDEIDVNQFSSLLRVYADNGIVQAALYEEMAFMLDSEDNLTRLNEEGFVNAYYSLRMHKHIVG